MITRMTRYSFIVLTRELDSFLERLQGLGMVDLTRSTRAVDDHSREQFELARRYRDLIRRIRSAADRFGSNGTEVLPDNGPAESLADRAESLFARLEDTASRLALLEKETEEAAAWGDFNPEDLRKLAEMGFVLKFYQVSAKRYRPEWETAYPLQILTRDEKTVRMAIVVPAENADDFTFPVAESRFPERPVREAEAERDTVRSRLLALQGQAAGLAGRIPELEKQAERLQEDLDRYLAGAAGIREGEDSLCVLEGFAPTENDGQICAFLEQSEAYFVKEAAREEDNPPVKLKNNFFSRLFEPIGDLYMLPRYGELDVTPFFAPFYMLFFGLCVGDMGYGLVLLLTGALVTWKLKAYRSYGQLIMLLGTGSVLMPALNGTFFGTKIQELITFPQPINDFFFSDLKMFWFGILFGIFQILVARLINAVYAIRTKGWQHGMANIGWFLLILWCTLAYAGSQTGTALIPEPAGKIMLYAGLALILFFSKTEGNPVKRLFSGLTSLYDITGVFGDVLSYIRLFGLGTSGGILGLVVNSIAFQMSGIPYVGWGLTVLMLLVGHTAVLGLSCLGAFVHPMRLTFVEFYKNVGFEGGGRAYRPLQKNRR